MKNFTKIFYLNPCFPTAKMFADITNAVSAHFDSESFNWIKSEEDFHFEDRNPPTDRTPINELLGREEE